MLLHINEKFTMVFLSIVSHSIRTQSPISRSTCPLNFLKNSSSFYPYILAHSSRACPLTFLKHSRSFYPHILAHSSRTCPFIILKHTRSLYQQYFKLYHLMLCPSPYAGFELTKHIREQIVLNPTLLKPWFLVFTTCISYWVSGCVNKNNKLPLNWVHWIGNISLHN
jgi:hypothetical protein